MQIEIYDVLKKSINQNFEKCEGEGCILVVIRIDFIALFGGRIANKKVIVRCNNSEKKISKRHWNKETKSEAKKLLAQHKTPKLGKIILLLIFIISFAGLISTFFNNSYS
ncbi:hypothetical protein OAC51_09975 [Flavobacteriaceae bacterium]|nr:hypothetical protein [Flavobacteriaceae bacterium]